MVKVLLHQETAALPKNVLAPLVLSTVVTPAHLFGSLGSSLAETGTRLKDILVTFGLRPTFHQFILLASLTSPLTKFVTPKLPFYMVEKYNRLFSK